MTEIPGPEIFPRPLWFSRNLGNFFESRAAVVGARCSQQVSWYKMVLELIMGYGKMFERMFVASVFRMIIGALLAPFRRRLR